MNFVGSPRTNEGPVELGSIMRQLMELIENQSAGTKCSHGTVALETSFGCTRPKEQAISRYRYLEDRLGMPFQDMCRLVRETSPLQLGEDGDGDSNARRR
jgi:hypothetical protein